MLKLGSSYFDEYPRYFLSFDANLFMVVLKSLDDILTVIELQKHMVLKLSMKQVYYYS